MRYNVIYFLLLYFIPINRLSPQEITDIWQHPIGGEKQAVVVDQNPDRHISDKPTHTNYCRAEIQGNILILENSRIARTFLWNNGNLVTRTLSDKQTGKTWTSATQQPDMSFPGQPAVAVNAEFSSVIVPQTPVKPEYLEATVTYLLGKLEVKRIFRIYPGCPAIACDLYLRGQAEKAWMQQPDNPGDLQNIEKLNEPVNPESVPVLEKLELPGKHWMLKTVEFMDVTDRFNTLVYEKKAMSYRNNIFRGNLLFATDRVSGNGFFILKEAPTSMVQLAYPGGDFLSSYGNIRLIGAGILHSDLDLQEWKKAYSFVTGVYGSDQADDLLALRNYQQRVRIHQPERDEMILMNTWGDRGQDTKVNERFCLAELDAGARLGITHFQLDDGWQTGRSANSAYAGGSFSNIWRNPDYWKPNPEKFPDGLTPIVEKGKKLGIEICLWFNPSPDDGNANWEKDAGALISLYRQYGIRTFKIDGVKMPDKQSEINFRKMLDKVVDATGGEVVFNLDVTAGRRGGYHSFNEYGNIFLENRYTDWQNYYPYWTLRNLWMLARYVPTQNLQIEFLNKWRNSDKYGDDPFAPENYSFDYLFAITMPAQPLAWFEGTGLPEEAYEVAQTIAAYKTIMPDFHAGVVLPVGTEPSGKSWTGFQSQKPESEEGFVVIYREMNPAGTFEMELPMLYPGNYRFEVVTGNGKTFRSKVGVDRIVRFSLSQPNSFVLYRYVKIRQ
ncbi:MAG: alpha-galactosidase [Mangrovibacterium sp.]